MSMHHPPDRMADQLREQVQHDPSLASRCRDFSEPTIRESPLLAMLAAFGIGMGAGAAIGGTFAQHVSRHRTAETLGRRMRDSLANVFPESVRHHSPS